MPATHQSPVNTTPVSPRWWSESQDAILQALQVDPARGLSNDQVARQRASFGANILEDIKRAGIGALILDGVKEPMMIVLLSIAVLSLAFGKPVEAAVMVFVVAAYIAVEFVNKFRSDRIMTRLRELTQPATTVVRDGVSKEVVTADVVTGDIVLLSEGMRVPADLRLLESHGLLVNEASLTGESLPVKKNAQAVVDRDAGLADRVNGVFAGTTVVAGEGKGIVLAVGGASELGTIARAAQAQRKERTFVQDAMTSLAKTLAVLAIVVSLLIPAIGFLRGLDLQEMVLTWLALTFLMIPGQPPVIITMALALASFELARKQIVVKRLRGAEVLGQVTAIVTDKTGTITENRMSVERFILADQRDVAPPDLPPDLRERIALCVPRYSNDPTDTAVRNVVGESVRREDYRLLQGFSDGHPWRTLAYANGGTSHYAIAGQPEHLIAASTFGPDHRDALLETLRRETDKGNRVVAFGAKADDAGGEDDSLARLTFLALAVLSDPVRDGVAQAVATLREAGIESYLVTGDHPATAITIAKGVGIGAEVLRGDELERMDDESLITRLSTIRVFARTSPSQKQRLVGLLQKTGHTVAVIGDGINDAPALKAANVGIAMGEIGTDLAKETADLILTDDNYVHLPDAIAIGRKAVDNFRKGLTYYLSAKAILLSIFLVPLALGIPFPFAPIHIILTELLMDLASSTIFVTEAAEPNVLRRTPETITRFLNWSIALKIAKNGALLAVAILVVYLWLYYRTGDLTVAQTAAFVTWLLGHIMLALNLKQEQLPLLRQGLFSNRFATAWLVGMVGLSLAMTGIPALHAYLHTASLPPGVWIAILLAIFAATWWIEAAKILRLTTVPSRA
jgi:P-type Ca2+ transporter type 2C